MPFDTEYNVIADHAIAGSGRRPGSMVVPSVKFVVAHDTGNPGASARNHARWYRNDPNPPRNLISSAHIFVDDEEVIETIPSLTCPRNRVEQARHVLYDRPTDNQLFGHDANRAAIGVELCFGGNIDPDRAYDRYVWVIAETCRRFGLDPAHRVTGHHILDPRRKVDPENALRQSGRSFAGLLSDVVGAVGGDLVGSARVAPGTARTTVRLQRRDQPKRGGASLGILAPGTELRIETVVIGENVDGVADWCQLSGGGFCWAGGVVGL